MASSPGAVDGQHNISSQISGHHPIFFRKFIFIYFCPFTLKKFIIRFLLHISYAKKKKKNELLSQNIIT